LSRNIISALTPQRVAPYKVVGSNPREALEFEIWGKSCFSGCVIPKRPCVPEAPEFEIWGKSCLSRRVILKRPCVPEYGFNSIKNILFAY
jgi:hypothetical protein